jgi:hypothetical protein
MGNISINPTGGNDTNARAGVGNEDEPPYPLIRNQIQRGNVIPFLGAGASLVDHPSGAGWTSPTCNFLPNARELAAYLDQLSGYPSSAPIELTRVAQYFEGVAGRPPLNEELRDVFAKRLPFGRLHAYLAASNCQLLVTTNYDCMLEQAFEERHRSYHHVVYRNGEPTLFYRKYDAQSGTTSTAEERVPNELVIPKDDAAVIYKMHGSADLQAAERDSYLITEDDYVQFLARMVSKTAIPAIFAEPFKKSHLLFLGYGLQDWNLRVFLYQVWQDWPSRREAWAIQHKAQSLEKKFWGKKQLTIYEKTIDHLLDRLEERADGATQN